MEEEQWEEVSNTLIEGSTSLLLRFLSTNRLARSKAFGLFKDCTDFILALLRDLTPLNEIAFERLIETFNDDLLQCKTEDRFFQHLERQRYYVSPQEIVVHRQNDVDDDDNHVVIEYKKVIVPLVDVYTSLFHHTDLLEKLLLRREEILREAQEDEVRTGARSIQSFIQGQLWDQMLTAIGVDSDLPDCDDCEGRTFYVPIFHNFDDFHTTVLFASHHDQHKMGGAYTNLPTLPRNLASKLEAFQLSSLHYSRDHNICGNHRIFQSIVDALNTLFYEGIEMKEEFRLRFNIKKVCFVPALQTGDLQGLYKSNGWVTAFATGHSLCFECNVPSHQRDEFPVERQEMLRTREQYQIDVQEAMRLQAEGRRHPNNFEGVKEESVFNGLLPTIHAYHCIFNMAFDVMHTFTEGILQNALSRILLLLNINIDLLNLRIDNFIWGPREKNRPSATITRAYLMANFKFNMSAAESLNFLYNILFLIGDLIPHQSLHWEMIIVLITLGKKLHQRKFNLNTDPPRIRVLVARYFALAIQLGIPRTPKAHILTHAANDLVRKGTFAETNCLRPEAKHADVKQADMHNRKNLPLTLAIKQQIKLAALLHQRHFTNDDGFQSNGTKKNVLQFVAGYRSMYIDGQFAQIVPNDLHQFRIHTEYRFNGHSVRTQDVIENGRQHDGRLQFYEIEKILSFTTNEGVTTNYLLCKTLVNEDLNAHLNAFRVRYPGDENLLELGVERHLILPLTNENIRGYADKSRITRAFNGNNYVDWWPYN